MIETKYRQGVCLDFGDNGEGDVLCPAEIPFDTIEKPVVTYVRVRA